MSDAAPASPAGAAPDATADARQPPAALPAGARLLAAARRAVTALADLLAAEAQVLRASAATLFISGVALLALAVSLWACIVALIGWAIAVAANSIGIALAALVGLHLLLLALVWFLLKRTLRSASFPGTRSELRALGGELHTQLERFQRTAQQEGDGR